MKMVIRYYVRIIRGIQAVGPYHLLGWSFGGLTAFGAGCQLRQEGEAVDLLAVLDAYPPSGQVASWGIALTENERLESIRKALRSVPRDLPTEIEDRIVLGLNASPNLLLDFRLERFEGDMLLFISSDCSQGAKVNQWENYVAGKIERKQVPWPHDQMTRPIPIKEIGNCIEDYMSRRIGLHGRGMGGAPI